jgi:hypothetical protein
MAAVTPAIASRRDHGRLVAAALFFPGILDPKFMIAPRSLRLREFLLEHLAKT